MGIDNKGMCSMEKEGEGDERRRFWWKTEKREKERAIEICESFGGQA